MKITLISDTHSYSDQAIEEHLSDSDEIWHAGDVGNADNFYDVWIKTGKKLVQ